MHFTLDNTLEIDMISQDLHPSKHSFSWQPSFFDWVKPNDVDLVSPGASAWDARTWWDLDKRSSVFIRDTREGAPRHHGWRKGDQGEVFVRHGVGSEDWRADGFTRLE